MKDDTPPRRAPGPQISPGAALRDTMRGDDALNGKRESQQSDTPQSATQQRGPQQIEARGLRKHYRARAMVNGVDTAVQRPVVDGVDIAVRRGETVGLLGPNGAGKTTSFYIIMGLVRPDGGQVLLDGDDITRWPMHRRAQAGIGYLAQNESVFRRLSVEDNVRAILELMPLSPSHRDARCEELLEDFDLLAQRRTRGIALSGGERRRTEIARALASDPAFILLDEPFTGVDPVNREEIQNIVRRLKARGIGILITDHNEMATLEIIDRGFILYEGRVITQGSARELLRDERARELYFGEKTGRYSGV